MLPLVLRIIRLSLKRINCPWRGNICAESLVQFPPTPSALIGGYKDCCDGLLQFLSLLIVAASAIEQMKASRSLELERFLDQLQDFIVGDSGLKADAMPQTETNRRRGFLCIYSCPETHKLVWMGAKVASKYSRL